MSSVEFPKKNVYESSILKNYNSSSDDEEDDYISSEELILQLQLLISNIKQGIYTDITNQDISDSIEEYISGKSTKPIDSEAISYLFRGWWITDVLKRAQNPVCDTISKPDLLENCPFCLKKMDSKYDPDIIKENE
jgi:hypothetical protein